MRLSWIPCGRNRTTGAARFFARKDLTQAIADLGKYLQLKPNASERTQVEQWLRELKGQ